MSPGGKSRHAARRSSKEVKTRAPIPSPSEGGGPKVTPRSPAAGMTSKPSASPVRLLRSRQPTTTPNDDVPAMSLNRLASDLTAAVLFCTRLPIPHAATIAGADIARASWAFPIAGAIVGLIAAGGYWLAGLAGLPSLPAAGLAIAATLVVTGCLHEDGLADVADAFGGHTRERKLEIMRDSRVGTYGACALSMSLLLRAAALASIAAPAVAAPVLVAAHMAARGGMPLFMWLVPPARVDRLAVGVGRPLPVSIAAAGLLS